MKKQPTTTKNTTARGGRTARYDRDAVVMTALLLIDRDGFDTFSMRALAAEMGIGVMTLYGYVSTKECIVKEIGKLLLGKLGTSVGLEAPWDVRIEQHIRDLYDVMEAHPGAIDIFVSELRSEPAINRVTDYVRESLLAILIDSGFTMKDTMLTVGCLLDYIIGHAIVHRNYEFRLRKLGHNLPKNALRKLYPNMAKVAPEYNAQLSRTTFEFGFSSQLEGIRLRFGTPRQSASRKPTIRAAKSQKK